MDLDQTFSSRDAINEQLRAILDEATDQWGCKIDRVEIKDITPPADIRDAMEKQMNALSLLGLLSRFVGMLTDSRSFLSYPRHEYFRRTLCNLVEADAEKEAKIRRAAGEAEAIKKVAEARADEIQMVYNAMMKAKPDDTLVQLKSLEALKDIANGDANKVFIPFEATSALASLGAVKEVFKDDKKDKKAE